MTRKHFAALAEALAYMRPPLYNFGKVSTPSKNRWENARDAIMAICAESNPRFDRDRFIAATLEG